MNVWVLDSDPGAAALGLQGSLGAADASVNLVGGFDAPSDGQRIFDYYNFGAPFTGQYVVFEMLDDGVNQFNPGGNELQLGFDDTVIPEPAAGVLGLLGVALILRRRRK